MILATAGLLGLSAPLFFVEFANSDVRALPATSEARRTYEAVPLRDAMAEEMRRVRDARR